MALEAKGKDSRWTVSRTALNKGDVEAFFEGAVYPKKASKESNSNETQKGKKKQTNKSIDPSSGNIHHSSQKMTRPTVLKHLALFLSQTNTPSKVRDDTSVTVSGFTNISAVLQSGNKVLTGRQLPRTPIVAKNHDLSALLVHKDDSLHCDDNLRQEMLSGHPECEQPKAVEDSGQVCKENLNACGLFGTTYCQHHHISSSSLPLLDVRSTLPKDKMEQLSATLNLENTDEATESLNLTFTKASKYSTRMAQSSKKMRISQVPIHRTSEIRVSRVLRRLPGCNLQSQDLEFLMQMEFKRKAKALKKELLCLRNEVMKVHWEKEGMLAVQDNVKKDIQQMKGTYDEVIKHGRSFLSRHHQVESVEALGDENVLSQLNTQAVLCVLHQQRAKLQRLTQEMKTRKNHDATITKQPMEENISQKLEVYNNQVKVAECTLQRAQEDVDGLKCRVQNLQQEVVNAEENLMKTQSEICRLKSSKETIAASKPMDEFEELRLRRKLERILRRMEIFMEREKIIQRLQKTLG
ncbi:uncharacterized protein LOC144772995 [Lissotriton helveticus]